MPDKFLVIGVGGSGGKTLRYLWRELSLRLAETKWEGGIPDAWRFIHVDLPPEPDVIEGDVPASIENAEFSYLGLGLIGRRYRDYDRDLVARGDLDPITGWRPDPDAQIPPPYRGASQRRAVGRIVTLSQLNQIGTALRTAFVELGTGEVMGELQSLAGTLGQEPPRDRAPLRTIVISSLSGGSGSGAVLDIVELLKSLPAAREQSVEENMMTVLYAPDVFGELDSVARLGIEPNALATLSELLSGAEHEGGLAEEQGAILHRGGGTNTIIGSRTAPHNFFIGARNSSIAFTTSHQVYQAVAKTLAAFIAHDDMRAKFEKYGVNVRASTVKPEFAITDADADNRVGRSFGYASVTLGNTLFEKYATERLAKAAIERLLRGHRENVGHGPPRRNDALIEDRVKQQLNDFLNGSGLREYTAEHNQVLDALRDPKAKLAKVRALASTVKSDLEEKSDKKSPRDWLASFRSTFRARENDFVEAEREERLKRTAEWSTEVQRRLLETVASSIGRNGLPVTARLIELLQEDVQKAADELDRSSTMQREEAKTLLDKAEGVIQSLREKVITATHSAFGDAAKERAKGLYRRTEADLHAFTAGLLREVHSDLLPPLRKAVGQAEARLRTLEEEDPEVQQWSARAVPPHLQPAPNDILLESHSEFPARLDDLLAVQFDAVPEQAQSDAVRELISGGWPRSDDESGGQPAQRLITGAGSWSPSAAGRGTRTGVFRISLDPPTVHAEARSWVRRRKEGEVTRVVGGSLEQWLDPGAPNATERAQRFADAIDRALAASAPLVSVNPTTFNFVHGEEMPRGKPAVGQIPLGPDHDAYARVVAALAAKGLNEGEIAGVVRQGGPPVSAVEISSFVGSAVHPVVFSSLVDPIQVDWKARRGPQDRAQFWQFARARPLPAFVPLAPWRLNALIRGWLTANLLGQVPRLEREWSAAGPLSVWTERGWLQFPKHLLGPEVRGHGLVLPALIESLPLALLELSGGEQEAIGAYLRLIKLGEPSGGPPKAYEEANLELGDWVRSGRLPEPQPGFDEPPEPDAAVAGSATGSPEERGAAIVQAITPYRAAYEELRDMRITPETSMTAGRSWEIHDAAVTAASELTHVVERLARPNPLANLVG
jgi:Tubulin like